MTETTHPTISCHNCGTDYIVALAASPVCPHCGTVQIRKGKPLKHINEGYSNRGFAPLIAYKVEQKPEGVVISWRRDRALFMFPMTFVLFLFISTFTVAPLFTLIGNNTDNEIYAQIGTILTYTGSVLLGAYFALIREKIIIAENEIIAPLTRHPLHIINDVVVRNMSDNVSPRKHDSYGVYLMTEDGEQLLTIMNNQIIAGMIAHRVKSIAQINTHQHTVPIETKTVKAKPVYQGSIQRPPNVWLTDISDGIDLSWQMTSLKLSTILAGISFPALIIMILGLFLLIRGTPSPVLMIMGVIFAGAGLLWLYSGVRTWIPSFQYTTNIHISNKTVSAYRRSSRNPKLTIRREAIQQVFVAREQIPYKRGKRTFYRYQYPIKAISEEFPEPVKIGDCDTLKVARYVEQEIENFLGLQNIPASGEFIEKT